MTLFLLVLLASLAFEHINGFHDTANAIATVVSTKVLTPRAAIIWAAFWNLIGALAGTAVAKTISGGLVEASAVDMLTATITARPVCQSPVSSNTINVVEIGAPNTAAATAPIPAKAYSDEDPDTSGSNPVAIRPKPRPVFLLP